MIKQTTLETSGEDGNLHSKRVEKMGIYTRNEWRRQEFTLETSGEDVKTTLETSAEDVKTTLETGGEDRNLHSRRV